MYTWIVELGYVMQLTSIATLALGLGETQAIERCWFSSDYNYSVDSDKKKALLRAATMVSIVLQATSFIVMVTSK